MTGRRKGGRRMRGKRYREEMKAGKWGDRERDREGGREVERQRER